MSESKVIPFDPARIPAEPRRNNTPCRHTHVLVDEKTRMLECDACKQVIDPFDYMWEWANRDRNLAWTREALKRHIERLSQEVAALKKDERNTRARLKRLQGKEGA